MCLVGVKPCIMCNAHNYRVCKQTRVNRGGSWNNNSDNSSVFNRDGNSPEKNANTIGFRVVRSAKTTD